MIKYGLIQTEEVQEAGARVFLNRWKNRFDGTSPSGTDIGDFLVNINMAIDQSQAEAVIREMCESSTRYGKVLAWEKRFQLVRDGTSGDHYTLRKWLTVPADHDM